MDVFINHERKLEDRRRSDTALVLTVNDINHRSAVAPSLREKCALALYLVTVRARRAAPPYGKPECLGSGGSMVAKLKLKGIDGKAPPGVELAAQFDSTRESLPGQYSC